MARTVVDTGNQLTNSAYVLSQSSQARREVARSGWSAARNSLESSMGIERGVDGRRKKVFRGLLKAALNLLRTGGSSGVDALSEAGKAGARAAQAHQCLSRVKHIHRRLHLIIRRSCRLSHMSRLDRLNRMHRMKNCLIHLLIYRLVRQIELIQEVLLIGQKI